jgi:hypothetical protein
VYKDDVYPQKEHKDQSESSYKLLILYKKSKKEIKIKAFNNHVALPPDTSPSKFGAVRVRKHHVKVTRMGSSEVELFRSGFTSFIVSTNFWGDLLCSFERLVCVLYLKPHPDTYPLSITDRTGSSFKTEFGPLLCRRLTRSRSRRIPKTIRSIF